MRSIVAIAASACLVGGGAAGIVFSAAAPASAVPSCDVKVDASAVHSAITTIQGGIDAASTGQTVCVYPGLYNQDSAPARNYGTGTGDFNIFVGTAGLTIEGLDSSGALIASAPEGASSTDAPVIEAAAQVPDFGTSNIFVAADNVTLRGLEINGDPNDIAKSVEIIGNGDTVTADAISPSTVAGGAGIYISDYNFDPSGSGTSTVKSYTFTNNTFDGDQAESAIYVASGAGWSGPVSGRIISGNHFSNMDDAMDFAGPTPEIGWLLYPVGTATITGNTFTTTGRRQLEVWGTGGPGVGYASPDWCSIMANNTMDTGTFIWQGATECPSGTARTWDVDDSPNGDFTNIAGLYSAIQRYGIGKAQAGDTLQVLPGTYNEQLVVDKAMTIAGAGQGTTTIQGPSTMADSTCVSGVRAVVSVCGSPSSTVTMSGVTISGGATGEDASNGCTPQITGVYVSDGETYNVSQSTVTNVYNAGGVANFGGCQQGVGIRAGSNALRISGSLIADHLTVLKYQKGGIVVDGPGSAATITNSMIEGGQLAGLSAVTAANGIQISRGASGSVSGSTVTGNQCTDPNAGPACGPDSTNDTDSWGIGLYDPILGQSPVPAISLTNNTVTGNDIGIYSTQLTGTPTISGNTVHGNLVGVHLDEGTATITGNQITNNGSAPFGTGVLAVQGSATQGGFSSQADTTATITGNTISGNPTGVKAVDDAVDAFTTHLTVMRNALTSNPTHGIDNQVAASTVNGTCNWWGQATGPAAGQSNGPVTTSPFLRLSTLTAACPATAPSAPRPTSAVPYNDHTAKVIWQAPLNNGGAAITGYVITPYLAGVAQPAQTFNTTALSDLVTGLTDAKSYQFAVAAKNAVGTGPMAPKTAAIIVGAPGQPGTPTVTKVSSGTLKVAFAAPMNNGAPITTFTASCTSSNGGATVTSSASASPITVIGTTPGKSYVCTVTAKNSRGTGPKSAPSAAKTA